MEVETELHGNCLLVRVQGELDHHWAGSLRETVDQALDQGESQNLVMNLEGLSFMDSSGIGVILGRYKRITGREGRMAICLVSPAVEKVLQISGVPRIIPFFNNEAEALQQISRGRPAKRRSR